MTSAIGIDIGGTSIKYGLVRQDGEVTRNSSKPTQSQLGKETVLTNIIECVEELQNIALETITAVGIGSSGLVDINKGIVKGGAPNLPDWGNLHLAEIISSEVGLPVFVDNDANLVGYGEYRLGGYDATKSHLFLTIGTGIGGVLIFKGELVRGDAFAGAEFGCIPMIHKNKEGYWEDFCSTSALVTDYISRSESETEDINGKIIVERLHSGEQLAREIFEEHFDLLGRGIGGLVNIFNPSTVIIGGGISESGQFYIDGIEEKVSKYALKESLEGVVFSAANHGNKAGLVGAALFALEMQSAKSGS